MQYLELIQVVAEKTHLPPQTVRLIIDTMKEIIVDKLCRREEVLIRGLGTFLVKTVYSPATQENVPAVRFRVAPTVKPIIKKGI